MPHDKNDSTPAPLALSANEWEARLGHAAWFKVCSACECGPSWDFATMAAVKALNVAVEIGFVAPEPPPILANCEECGPVRFLDEDGSCSRCEQPVEMLAAEKEVVDVSA